LKSVENAIRHVGGKPVVVKRAEELEGLDRLILPGVGAYDSIVEFLIDGGWQEPLNQLVLSKKVPILGICLGMQVMLEASEEGTSQGLGWIRGRCKRFLPQDGLTVPHMGWNYTKSIKNSVIDLAKFDRNRFYFVHSYHAVCEDTRDVWLTSEYGGEFVAAFSKDNISGVQFHPEKSHKFGLNLLKGFISNHVAG